LNEAMDDVVAHHVRRWTPGRTREPLCACRAPKHRLETMFSIFELLGVLQTTPTRERACTATRIGLAVDPSDDKR
jgi:hypothetical protein